MASCPAFLSSYVGYVERHPELLQSFALAGVSMGGMVALEIVRIAPERVMHLALVDSNARPDSYLVESR